MPLAARTTRRAIAVDRRLDRREQAAGSHRLSQELDCESSSLTTAIS